MIHKGTEREQDKAWQCGYSALTILPACDHESTWHGIVMDGGKCKYSMTSCETHKGILEKNSTYVHELDGPCCLPGSVFHFPDNYCEIPWDMDSLITKSTMAVPA